MTRFQILACYLLRGEERGRAQTEHHHGWHEHSVQEAHNAEAAIRAAYLKASNNVLAMVAIPARSWKPTPIRTETVTKVVLGASEKAQESEA